MRTLAVTLLCLASLTAAAQAVPAPVALQVMLKLVTYDASFPRRGDGDFVVVVPYGPGQSDAAEQLLATTKALPQSKIVARPLRFVGLPDPGDDARLLKTMETEGASAVLLLPGGRLKAYAELAKAKQLYTFALDPADAESRALFGVATRDGKPWPVVNLAAAKELGVQLPAPVLKVAKLVQAP